MSYNIHLTTSKIAQFVCLAATTTALTHLSVIVPAMKVLFWIAAGVGVVWIVLLAIACNAAQRNSRFRWFDNLGDFASLLPATAFITAAFVTGLALGHPDITRPLRSAAAPNTTTSTQQ